MRPGQPTTSRSAPDLGMVSWRAPVIGTGLLTLAAQAGLAAVQVDFGGHDRGPWLDAPGNLARLRRQASDTGVRLSAVAGNLLNDVGLTAPEGTTAAMQVRALIDRMLDAAAALGCPLVFLPSFRRSAIDGPLAFDRTSEVLAWASSEASLRGLVLGNENTLGPARASELVTRVDAANFKLVLDVHNLPRAGVDPVEVVTALTTHLADQVHLKNGVGEDTTVPLSQGDFDIVQTLDELARQAVAVNLFVLENDYRDGDLRRLNSDIAWARRQAQRSPKPSIGARV